MLSPDDLLSGERVRSLHRESNNDLTVSVIEALVVSNSIVHNMPRFSIALREYAPVHRAYYESDGEAFCRQDELLVLGSLTDRSEFSVELTQREAWLAEIRLLQTQLAGLQGQLYLEFSIPRMGQRADAILLVDSILYVLEFKVGETSFSRHGLDQVTDYALDLKHFHSTSHHLPIVPVLIATQAKAHPVHVEPFPHRDKLYKPLRSNGQNLAELIQVCREKSSEQFELGTVTSEQWNAGRYSPTPTIIEAALALYKGHGVADIARRDACGETLANTSNAISTIIEDAKAHGHKAICFVTCVPGAGKTLIGLDVATKYLNHRDGNGSVFLSGNGPLVKILQEALARDRVRREKQQGRKFQIGIARSEVKAFVQNVHHYRDEYLRTSEAPTDHIALFDEAQRAWHADQTIKSMRQKKGQPNFSQSEPEYLISCIDRHQDWGVVVCLVGAGQEINTGEAGIGEWLRAIHRSYPDWRVFVSDRLVDSEYQAHTWMPQVRELRHVTWSASLHLSVSMRSYRAENVSLLVKQILDVELDAARKTYRSLDNRYPIVLTRNIERARDWLRTQARGSERYGIVASSQAIRLKPLAIDIRPKADPIHWFLADRTDIRSSYYLEDVATEFDIQGLELDWVCVTWDADFRFSKNGWRAHSFRGERWQNINKAERQSYMKNAYRVLMTRARQGMVICVPEGSDQDPTRTPSYYDTTFEYLQSIGLQIFD